MHREQLWFIVFVTVQGCPGCKFSTFSVRAVEGGCMLQPPQLRTAIVAFQPLGVSGALSLPVYQSLDWLVLAIRYRSQNRQSQEILCREVSESPWYQSRDMTSSVYCSCQKLISCEHRLRQHIVKSAFEAGWRILKRTDWCWFAFSFLVI